MFNLSFSLRCLVCGCGDDLVAGNDGRQEGVTNVIGEDNQDNYVGFGRYFYNFGFTRNGTFRDLDIISVHPSTREDPTAMGQLGTDALRNSKEVYSPELTFSVVYRDNNVAGVHTLDVECASLESYFTLLKGFKLLQEEADSRRGEDGIQVKFRENMKSLESLWLNAKNAIKSMQKKPDPVAELYAPNTKIDPFRAVRVGGGLMSNDVLRKHLSSPMKSPMKSPDASFRPTNQPRSLPVAQFLGWKSAGTQIWARLKMAGLDVKCVFCWDLSRVILKIRCPQWRLEQMAEQMHIKIKTRSGYLKPFRVSHRDSFVPYGLNGSIFRSSERQQIIDYILRSKIKDGGAELDVHTELGKHIVQRFPLHMYSRLVDIRHSWITFWKRERPGQIAKSFSPFKESYRTTWNYASESCQFFFNNLLTQPLDNIAEYFGESIAFYFAFMAYYTRWLVFPSILGIIVFAVQISTRQLDHWICAPYAVLIMIWVCFMLAFWRQKASALSYRWGVLDYEVEETERPQFQGDYMIDESTGELRKNYPLWKRFARYMLSVPILAGVILLMLLVMSIVFYSQDRLYDRYLAQESLDYSPHFPPLVRQSIDISFSNFTEIPLVNRALASANTTMEDSSAQWGRKISLAELVNRDFWAVTFFYPCLYGMLVSIITMLFNNVAIGLNEFENHRTQTIFMNRLILKVFSFQFVTIFTSLYYYAFFTKDQEGGFTRISVTIFSLMTVGQWWQLFLDIGMPTLYHRVLLYRQKANFAVTNRKIYAVREITEKKQKEAGSESKELQEQLEKRIRYLLQAKSKCWEEALQAKYNNFSDYTSLVIQMCFILFFGAVFPLAPLIALVNNIVLIRFKAVKVCYTRQRPIAQKIGGIGVWSDVLQILSVGGAITNCALIGFVSDPLRKVLVPAVGDTGIALIMFAFEQGLLLFKYWLHTSIPSVPPSVVRAQLRERKSISNRDDKYKKKHKTFPKKEKKSKKRSSVLDFLGNAFQNNHDDDYDPEVMQNLINRRSSAGYGQYLQARNGHAEAETGNDTERCSDYVEDSMEKDVQDIEEDDDLPPPSEDEEEFGPPSDDDDDDDGLIYLDAVDPMSGITSRKNSHVTFATEYRDDPRSYQCDEDEEDNVSELSSEEDYYNSRYNVETNADEEEEVANWNQGHKAKVQSKLVSSRSQGRQQPQTHSAKVIKTGVQMHVKSKPVQMRKSKEMDDRKRAQNVFPVKNPKQTQSKPSASPLRSKAVDALNSTNDNKSPVRSENWLANAANSLTLGLNKQLHGKTPERKQPNSAMRSPQPIAGDTPSKAGVNNHVPFTSPSRGGKPSTISSSTKNMSNRSTRHLFPSEAASPFSFAAKNQHNHTVENDSNIANMSSKADQDGRDKSPMRSPVRSQLQRSPMRTHNTQQGLVLSQSAQPPSSPMRNAPQLHGILKSPNRTPASTKHPLLQASIQSNSSNNPFSFVSKPNRIDFD